MSYLDRIATCRAWDPAAYRPFLVGGVQVGRIRHRFARRLADFGGVFRVGDRAVALADGLPDFAARSAAMGEVLLRLKQSGEVRGWRGEEYPVLRRWGEAPLMTMERAAVPLFGVRGFGVNLNGFVAGPEGLRMWVGRRSRTKETAPGKLDHMVGGGQPYGLGVRENLLKEAGEEAGLPRQLASGAVPVGAVSYRCEREEGLRDDVFFNFDLELPAGFTPTNSDGEVESFALWPMARVMATIRDSEDFKFNVTLVILDFAIRHGILGPDDPDYQETWEGLHRPDTD